MVWSLSCSAGAVRRPVVRGRRPYVRDVLAIYSFLVTRSPLPASQPVCPCGFQSRSVSIRPGEAVQREGARSRWVEQLLAHSGRHRAKDRCGDTLSTLSSPDVVVDGGRSPQVDSSKTRPCCICLPAIGLAPSQANWFASSSKRCTRCAAHGGGRGGPNPCCGSSMPWIAEEIIACRADIGICCWPASSIICDCLPGPVCRRSSVGRRCQPVVWSGSAQLPEPNSFACRLKGPEGCVPGGGAVARIPVQAGAVISKRALEHCRRRGFRS